MISGSRIRVVLAAMLGLVLGWYLSAAIAGPAIRVHFVFLRGLAAAVGAASAATATHLWCTRRRRTFATVAATLGLLAVAGLGFWMMAAMSRPA
jgi:hypothetical protein